MPEIDLSGYSILIIDDVIERGATMDKTVEILSQKCKPELIKTASLVVDTNLCQKFPDFYVLKQEKDWIMLPWESDSSNFGIYKKIIK